MNFVLILVQINFKLMKKLLLGVVASFFALEVVAQVVVAGISPASIQRNFTFGVQAGAGGWPGETEDGTWGLASDFNVDGTYVQGELILMNDGTPGTNTTYGNLLSEEGCNPSTAGAYAGKIVVLRRNTCEFGTKALNAQNAGALAVILVNREDAEIGMLGGVDGINVTIPMVAISSSDGNQLITEMASGPVVMFIGNKFGIFNNDLGSDPGNTIIATQASTPSILAQNGTEFSFTPGIQIVNYGLNTQSDIYVTATVAAPGNPTAYSEVLGPLTMNYKDTAALFAGNPDAFPALALASYPVGEYTLTYTVSLGVNTDEAPGDNAFTSKFYVTEDIFSYARHNAAAGEPVVNSFPKNYTQGYKSCIRFNDANADRAGVLGLHTAVSIDTSQFALGQQIQLFGYKWNDAVNTLTPAATYDALVQVAYASFDAIETSGFLNGQEVFIPFETPFILENNQLYLFCVVTETPEPAFGYDNGVNYNANMGISNNVTFPIYIDNTGTVDDSWFSAGWNGNPAPSIGLQLFPAAELGLTETSTIEASVYPNPTNDNVTITVNAKGAGNLVVTDITGKIVMNNAISLANGQSNVNMSSLEVGLYIFNITLDNGKTAQFNVVKK
jgi:hypothetical protein